MGVLFLQAFLAAACLVHASGGENTTSASHISVYGFGTDFSARVIHHAIFQVSIFAAFSRGANPPRTVQP
jgi:hypothetical protein